MEEQTDRDMNEGLNEVTVTKEESIKDKQKGFKTGVTGKILSTVSRYADIHKENAVFIWSIYLIAILSTIISGILCSTPLVNTAMNLVTSFAGIMIFIYYYERNDSRMINGISSQKVFIISFAVSNVLIIVGSLKDVGSLWLAAIAVIAVMEGIEHAVSCHVVLLMQYVILAADIDSDIRKIIFYAVLGILLAIIVSDIEKKGLFAYVAVVFIVLSLVMIIVVYQFNLNEIFKNGHFVLVNIIGNMVLTGLSWITYVVKTEGLNIDIGIISKNKTQKRLLQLLEKDNDLLIRMKEHSEALYNHSVRISDLSYNAAEYMECNSALAGAGGMYHEAGRIYNDKNYMSECDRLAEEYDFPDELTDVIKQHSMMFDKPKSIEAAIVMLSDCIISTSEYLEKTGKRKAITDEKLVRSIFNNRISKGNLDDAGIEKEQIERLTVFYIENAF